ncbi:MAG TPA: S-adenosylmethionine:tRNA ribosyltransferase-isomerase, partial [Kofleriaceae bacterium]|nr:S-adenosylmethionine:tRNA ribosyltransferase-isomerase [Kofleriaceae bacterium]
MKFRGHHSTQLLRTDEVPRRDVRLVVVEQAGVSLRRFAELPLLLREGDLVVVNDAATLPASLRGATATGEPFELRLSAPVEGTRLTGVVFGPGDHTTRTEHRPLPPPLGDRVTIAGLPAEVVTNSRDQPAGRRVELVVQATRDALWQAMYAHGRPVQYAHRRELLPLYEVQTAYAARPWAAEMPSAGRPLTWQVLLELRRHGIAVERLTHAAGLWSIGDAASDRTLPWPERYEIPRRTLAAVVEAKARGGRVIAVGTTVVRALESAAPSLASAARDATGTATLVLGPSYQPRVVDGLVSGLHAPGESHFELLSAFAPRDRLVRAIELAA